MRSRTYREQWHRLVRSYERFAEIDKGRQHDMSSENYRDRVYVFFQDCHHLKDWLKNDPNGFVGAQEVEDYISANWELQLCADICNTVKHLELRDPRSGESPQLGSQKISLVLAEPDQANISIKYTMEAKSGSMDAFALATKCLGLWKSFILEHGGTA